MTIEEFEKRLVAIQAEQDKMLEEVGKYVRREDELMAEIRSTVAELRCQVDLLLSVCGVEGDDASR